MQRNAPQQPLSSNVYIGLIPFEWDVDNLKAVVCGLGNVVDVRLGFDHVGKNKGFAFVEFETPQDAVIASQLLSKTQIVMPGLGQVKRFRTEVSKDSFRSGNGGSRAIIPLNLDHLPAGVQFPPEAVVKNPQLLRVLQAKYASYTNADTTTNPMFARGASHTPPLPRAMNNISTIAPLNSANNLPEQYLRASQFLPKPQALPFEVPDKINQTLSEIPPPQLIELIANLKSILSSPDAVRAAEIFHVQPNLAAAVTQALLLMGFIDEQVIQEAMKAEAGNITPQPAGVPPQHHNYQGVAHNRGAMASQSMGLPDQNYGSNSRKFHNNQNINPVKGQETSQDYGQTNKNNDAGQRYGSGFVNNTNQPHLPPPPVHTTNSRWPHLPLLTQMKLSALPNDQAELIAQVLSLSPEQVSALPPDRQNMVLGIKQQYS